MGALTAITAVLAASFWQVLVDPDALLAPWRRGPRDPFTVHHPAAVRALRYALGALLVLSAFLTGLTLTFLAST